MKVFNETNSLRKSTSSMRVVLLGLLGLCISLAVTSQKRTVSGTVKDIGGDPMIGVSVVLKGTVVGTITNFNGQYTIEATSNRDVLVFSYIGYESKSESVGNKTIIDVTMLEDTKMLDELVVVGYGTQRKSDLTGSVVSVKAEDMNAIPTTSIAEMLRGQAAGVVVTQNTNRPGASSSILIRGKRSLTGGNAPLFIVDGVPVSNIDDFNAQDILSVEVLKDASSQSIYGARASNGVILVTTKRGADNRLIVDFSSYYATQQLKRNFDFYDGDEWIQMKREANRSFPDGVYLADDGLFGIMYQNLLDRNYTDWEALALSAAPQQKYDLSVRAGNQTTKLTTSLGYFKQEGVIQPANYERANFRVNLDHELNKKLKLGINLNYTYSNRQTEDETFSNYITRSPLLDPTDDSGNIIQILEDSRFNPLWNNLHYFNFTEARRLLLNTTLDWKIAKGLNYRLNASMNQRNSEQGIYQDSFHERGATTNGRAVINFGFSEDYLIENIVNYDYNYKDIHKWDATFVQSVNLIKTTDTSVRGYGFTTDDLMYNNIGAAAKTDPVQRDIIPRTLLSYLGRLRYNLLDRYLFSASARIDGSSVFGANNKWGVFPATSFAWRISEESFLSEAYQLSNLKLRLSYGDVGNQAISPYRSQGLVDPYFMQFGSSDPFVGYLPGPQLPNPNLKWETTSSFNSGLDFGLFRDRLSGSVDYYYTITKDLLMQKSINQITGYNSQLVNIGKVMNRGVEVMLNVIPIKLSNFSWNFDLTFGANENKIIELNGELDAEGNPINDLANNWFIGHNIDAYFDYQFDGIWQFEDEIPDFGPNYKPQPGDIRVKDLNEDGLINPEDRMIIDRAPKWTGSISNTLRFYGVDLAFDFYFVQGAVSRNQYLYDSNSGGDLHGRSNGIKVNYWTLENPSTTNPRPRDATIQYFSSLGYQDASYIRLRNLSLGYNLPKTLLKSLKINSVKIYGTATNLWTMTDFLSYSPELSAGSYPEPRTFLLGINASF